MALKYAVDGKLYLNTGETYASPTWTEVVNVKDLTLSLSADKADGSSRLGGGWKANAKGLKDLGVQFQMNKRTTDDEALDAFRTAFLGDGQVDVMVLDGDKAVSGSEGIRAVCEVFNCTRNEKLGDPITFDIELAVADSDHPPSWITETGS